LKLVIDIGNTSAKIAIFDNTGLIDLQTVVENLHESLINTFKKYPSITSSIVSAVSDYDNRIPEFLKKNSNFLELTHSTPVPFTNKYSTPQTLGKDRIAIAAAAISMFPHENVLVIDAGTCVTYDFVDSSGEYLGGSISPGLIMRLKALNNYTNKLPLESLPEPNSVIELIGESTRTSILSGVVIGLKSELEHITNQYEIQFSPLKVVISGGDYKYFENTSKSNIFASPNIVINGLKEILIFNEED